MEDGDGNFDSGDRSDQFHRNEAISAVADDGFLGEEEEDDYEDLYNDVNVGDGFLQTLKREDETDEIKPKIEPPVSIPGVGGGGGGGSGSGSGSGSVDVKTIKKEVIEEELKGPPELGFRGKIIKKEVVEEELKGPPELGFRGNELGIRGPRVKVEMGEPSGKFGEIQGQFGNNNPQHGVGGGNAFVNANVNIAHVNGGGPTIGGGAAVGVAPAPVAGGVPGASNMGGTVLYVGELHWWTTDAQLESELSKYGPVKELKFYDEKASGKSKGYCQVEFYDAAVAAACKEGMNGYVFNGRPCVVAFASPYSVRRMGEAMVNKNQAMGATQTGPMQGRRGPADVGGRGSGMGSGTNYQNFGRGGWGRGGGGMANRGPMGPMRNRVGMGGRGIIGNNGNGFGQGLPAAPPPLLQPQAMMGQGFDPTYGATMGRMGGGYGGFPAAPMPPFSGVLSSFPAVGGVGLPGVAPHVNPAFFGRGMPANGMGMMPATGVENVGMWSDPSMGGWAGEDQGGRAGESSYGEDAVSDHQYVEAGGHEKGGWSNTTREKDRAPERDLSGGAPDRRYRDDRELGWDRDAPRERDTGRDQEWSERRHRDDREAGWDRERDRDRDRDRDRYREDRDRYLDHHRYRDREPEHDDEWDRGRSSRSHHSKSRLSHEEEQRQRLRDVEPAKRRRLPSE